MYKGLNLFYLRQS